MKTLLCYYNLDGFAVQLKNHILEALEELQIEWQECHITDLEKVSRAFQPIMTIHFHPNSKIYDYLPVIKSLGGHRLLWDMESPYESDLVFDMLNHFYYIFTSDENTANELKKVATANKISYVPHACNPCVHRKQNVTYEYRSDILFVGNAYQSRLDWFFDHQEEYQDKLVTIIGVGYRGLAGYQHQRVIHGHISEEEMVKYISGAKLVLNLHRQNSDLDMANSRNIQPSSYNNRFYEVGQIGTPQLVVGRDKEFIYNKHLTDESYRKRLVEFYLPLLK